MLGNSRLKRHTQPPEISWEREDGTDQDSQEHESRSAQAKSVDLYKDDRERLKPHIKQTVDERRVQIERQNNWLRKRHREWPHKRVHQHFFNCHSSLVRGNVGLAHELEIPGQLSQPLGSPVQDVGGRGFGYPWRRWWGKWEP